MEKNELYPQDVTLFSSMKKKYVSDNERTFFKNMQYKEEQEMAFANDVILSEFDNEDELYIVRRVCDEYVLGRGQKENRRKETIVVTLADALSVDLADIGLMEEHITLWEWLRQRDYKGINYKGNNDYL